MTTPTLESHATPLGSIRIPENVRDLDQDHVDALARSIALQGMLVPIVVRSSGAGFELVAGFHRAAAAKLGLAEVPVVVRDAGTEDADRAVENITRKQLNPYEPGAIASDATLSVFTRCDAAWLLVDAV
jgi:ParB/RepB/Spo0J family partition protein